jgi:hypothetical protein
MRFCTYMREISNGKCTVLIHTNYNFYMGL